MQGQNQQQAYDRGTSIFSPDGRLYQVEYAREAVERGSSSIGIRTDGGVVLAAEKQTQSSLMESSSVEKLHKADDHIGVASAGHVADARQLVDYAREQAQVEQLRYGQSVGVETLTKSVTDNIQQYTQSGGARPFGVALLIGGIENGQPRLFETDPSGTATEWQATAIGANRTEIQSHLEEQYHADLMLGDGIGLAVRALDSVSDTDLSPETVSVATVDVDSTQYEPLDRDALAPYFEDDSTTDGYEA